MLESILGPDRYFCENVNVMPQVKEGSLLKKKQSKSITLCVFRSQTQKDTKEEQKGKWEKEERLRFRMHKSSSRKSKICLGHTNFNGNKH